MRTGPCTWPLAPVKSCSALDGLDLAERTSVEDAATALLWNWTGKMYGVCDVSIRPCRIDTSYSTYRGATGGPVVPTYGTPWFPALIAGEWHNLTCGSCGGDTCACDSTATLVLPGPVSEVTAVRIDGFTVDAADYRLDGNSRLIRTDGQGWPTSQDLEANADEQGAFVIDYQWGAPVPTGGSLAAAVLACEFAKAVTGAECALPQRIQTITREGVTTAILDGFESLEAGRTGLWLVDSWVVSVTKAPKRSTVASPDYRPAARRV